MSKTDGFFKSSSLLFAGMMAANIINYLFQLTLGRMLDITTYGEMNTLMSIIVLLSSPVYSVTVFLTKRLSHNIALGRYDIVKGIIASTYRGVLIVGVVTSIIGVVSSRRLGSMLKIDDVLSIVLLFIAITVYVLVLINSAILQSLHRFSMLSLTVAGSSFLKYALCVALAAAGMGLSGIMAGLMLSYVLTVYVSDMSIRSELKTTKCPVSNHSKDVSDVSLSFLMPVTAANLAFSLFSQIDLVLIKYFFSPTDAGIYSSAAIIGKSVIHVPAAIVTSLFPMVASSWARAESTIALIAKALGLTLVLSGGGAVILYSIPELIISIFFGAKFMPASKLIGLYAMTMLPVALIMVLLNYNIARNKTGLAYVTLLCAIGQVAGIFAFHDTPAGVLRVMSLSGYVCVTLLAALMAVEYLSKKVKRHQPTT
ncbi:oligosaccharide flippase family protein [Candidatus Magnetobacterium casense]|uniref:Oligosaccharide flippase family protein n=1 Tax=Candidatus Magnetobacterium casense TaxID=1455061 RepID=A0ABS6S044_9BACT|nr:oligosaccharide flippase family protein [Candidatus Magnetobacterium casensis]MBV6341950.1 oligosaccharide flippase family protein [Candidatus Magnetobacterium casensis]